MRDELGTNAPAIATGGLSHVLSEMSGLFNETDQMLTLRGLKLVAAFC
jgi:pantothenate kinase type III